jgi:signal transduction histidine kinase
VSLPGTHFETSRKIPEDVFASGREKMVADLRDGDIAGAHEGTVALGIRKVLCVPLRAVRVVDRGDQRGDSRPIGVVYLDSRHRGTLLSHTARSALATLVAEAGVAIENARLYDEASRRQRWLAATAEITALLTAGRSGLNELQTIADRAREVAGADVAWILTGQDRASLNLRAISGVEADPDVMRQLHLERSLAGVVVETGALVAVEDIATDPRALDVSEIFGWPSLGPAVVVPLRSGEQVDGALALAWSRERAEEYYTLDPALPAGFAEHATLVLQIVRAREDRQRLEMLEDRDRIGRELHDVVIQRLFAVGLGLQGTSRLVDRADVAGRLDQAVDDLDATIKDIRRSIFALTSTDASHDIQAEVTRLVDRAAGTLKFRPTLRFEGPVRSLVSGDLAPDVLAVLGEALSNASRHADARSVHVLLSAGSQVVLRVADDGRGLDASVPESGLRNMRERAERRGGTFEVESARGEGTVLTWSVPAS